MKQIQGNKIRLHIPIANFALFQRGLYYAVIETCNALPIFITSQVMNKKCFIKNLQAFLLDKPLYSSELVCMGQGLKLW
jgi:hypothetical protein